MNIEDVKIGMEVRVKDVNLNEGGYSFSKHGISFIPRMKKCMGKTFKIACVVSVESHSVTLKTPKVMGIPQIWEWDADWLEPVETPPKLERINLHDIYYED